MDIPKNGVAFFDSGIGGLTVLATCKKLLPGEIFYYYGDNLNAPYGNKPPQEICFLVEQAFKEIVKLSPKAVVVACNTATAICIERLRRNYPFSIIGTEPAIRSAVKECKNVLVLSTRATYQSQRFIRLCEKIKRQSPNVAVTLYPCDNLAGEIEKNVTNKNWDVAPHLPKVRVDGVVLGCTHYIYKKEEIQSFYQAKVFDGNDGIANRLISVLAEKQESENFLADTQLIVQDALKTDNIFFLGGGKWSNKTVYEQMFAYFSHENGY